MTTATPTSNALTLFTAVAGDVLPSEREIHAEIMETLCRRQQDPFFFAVAGNGVEAPQRIPCATFDDAMELVLGAKRAGAVVAYVDEMGHGFTE